MNDVLVDRLCIRGEDARRLATVAARALPGALERALGDLADVELGRLMVPLSDPADHDDATLAVLWADGIRRAALAAGARVRAGWDVGAGRDEVSADPGDLATSGGPTARQAGARWLVDVDEVAAALSIWPAAGAAIPAEIVALCDPAIAEAVVRELGAARAAGLARRLEDAVERLWTTRNRRDSRPSVPTPALDRPPRDATGGAAFGAEVVSSSSDAAASTLQERVAHAARTLRPWLERQEAAALDLAWATRAAGVALLYPWLAELCRDAVERHPHAEPSHARRVALAALADPEDPDLVDDPLLRFLAAAPEDATAAGDLAPLDAVDEVRADAEDVLRRFVALLPGFERSSPRFVRDAWVQRPGLLDVGRDPATLLAHTMPLDVMLPLLPYPMGVLRLPWTAVLTVRFRP